MQLEKKIKIKNISGLHARPAALFVQIANKYDSEVILRKGIQEVNGKSIMGIMMLAAEYGSEIVLQVEGDDAQEALKELEEFLKKEN
jgi:phosphotransferase system HPr (HPr) family protein